MGGYLANFTVYTMAMTGLICFAVFVYKKIMDGSLRTNNSKFLSVEETMSLNPRKTLHIVRAGNEKFLIASDVDRTTLISKLDSHSQISTTREQNFEHFKNIEAEGIADFEQFKTPEKTPAPQPPMTPAKKVQTVHLEPITTKNPAGAQFRKNMDRREVRLNNQQQAATLNFEKPQTHGFSTMKEMAKKINEL